MQHSCRIGGTAAFDAVLNRLSGGDTLVVWTLASAAPSLEALVSLVCQLMEKDISFESLTEQFTTAGKSRASVAATFDQLRRFKDEIKKSHIHRGSHGQRIGRPRALDERTIEKARIRVVKMGEAIDVVARDLGVSRATLYRYMDAEH